MSDGLRGAEYCGCCEGTDTVTPRDVFNRPGLADLRRRVGDYADFFETMRSRISRVWVDLETTELGGHGRPKKVRVFPLRALKTRAHDDPAIALLDLWAVVGDILSFYTERIANEGYLRTATELRSVSELARLVGYRRRPGVSASTFVAFTADDSWTKPLVVPAGARVQSMPDPGEPPVFFETGAPLPARAEWNVLHPRRARPTHLPFDQAKTTGVLHLDGTATRLVANTPLLLSYGTSADDQVLRHVASVKEDFDQKRTRVDLLDGVAIPKSPERLPVELDDLVQELERPPSIPPATPAKLGVSATQAFGPGSAAFDGLVAAFHPAAAESFAAARANAPVTPEPTLQAISALRVKASIYGSLAPPPTDHDSEHVVQEPLPRDWVFLQPPGIEDDDKKPKTTATIDLDTTYDSILPGTWVVVQVPKGESQPFLVKTVETVHRSDYHFPATVTRLVFSKPWLVDAALPTGDIKLRLATYRDTTVYAVAEPLAPTDEPVEDPVCGAEIELDRQIASLDPGRWIIVSGERAVSAAHGASNTGRTDPTRDVFSTPGVPVSELTMILGVRQDTLQINNNGEVVAPSAVPAGKTPSPGGEKPTPLPGDRSHTFLQLATPLSYCYRRDTLRIYANVAHATHGETREESLGSGDATKILQSFTLNNDPLTHVSAPTTDGTESTLRTYVNDVRWHEAENPFDLGPADRGYLTFADHADKTSVTFGDGRNGARLPTGTENVRAVYRSGTGRVGNVRANQLKLLVTNTEGLRGVINPQRASGGADPDGIDPTRARAPLAVTALDRLVATRDYADFALLSAGVAKASSARLPSAHGRVVQVTLAGEDDIPIDPSSDLHRNLLDALGRFGDPNLPVRVVHRELLALVIGAGVRILPDYLWAKVRPQIEASLRDELGFEHRRLAQDAYPSEVLAAMQAVPGVDYVDLNLFTAIPESIRLSELATLGTKLSGVAPRVAAAPDRVEPLTMVPLPAQLAALVAGVPTAVMLTEIPNE